MKNYWQSDNIKLRGLEEEDLNRIIDNRESVDHRMKFYFDFIDFPKTEDELKLEFEERKKRMNQTEQKIFIIESFNGGYVGEINIWGISRRNRTFRHGIFIEEEFRRKGYAKEALVIVFDYYFNELNYHKNNAVIYSFNKVSQRFHEAFGFRKEGVLREDYYTNGHYVDVFNYGILKKEFNENHKHSFRNSIDII